MQKIDGRFIAAGIIEELKKKPAPGKILAAILVGNDLASSSFIKIKEKVAGDLSIRFDLYQLPDLVSQEELEDKIKKVSNDPKIGGIIVQLPLPKKFDRERALSYINHEKDVDGLVSDLVESPVVGVIKEILKSQNKSLNDLSVAVVGKGRLVGQPIIKWLKKDGVKFKVADSQTENLQEVLSGADLIITGVGKKDLINPEWLKKGAGIIDFGFPPDLQILKIENCKLKIGFYTPTPGGTGPILVAELFKNFYILNS